MASDDDVPMQSKSVDCDSAKPSQPPPIVASPAAVPASPGSASTLSSSSLSCRSYASAEEEQRFQQHTPDAPKAFPHNADGSKGVVWNEMVLYQLARQLEYYFSTQNLSRDTYVQTLRSLNDGCVPVTILVNFSKVKAIVGVVHDGHNSRHDDEDARVQAVLQATTEYSELLKVYSIESISGKITTDDTPSSASTILAIGTISKEALVLNDAVLPSHPPVHSFSFKAAATFEQPSSPGTTNFANTIILRDVNLDVQEGEIREMFQYEGCPRIEHLRCDMGSCWFVTLDTHSREDMLRVMMRIRTQSLRGDYVQARLKASTSAPIQFNTSFTTPPLPPLPVWPAFPLYHPTSDPFTPLDNTQSSCMLQETDGTHDTADGASSLLVKKKKKNKKNRKKANINAATNPLLHSKRQSAVSTHPIKTKKMEPKSISMMSEDEFPTLQVKKVEFETMPLKSDEKEEERFKSTMSDNASTATTNSSSVDSFGKAAVVIGRFTGYANALLNVPMSNATISELPVVSSSGRDSPKAMERIHSASSISLPKRVEMASLTSSDPTTPPCVRGSPPIAWGRSRSFADILRDGSSVTRKIA